LEASKEYYRLLEITGEYWRMLEITGDCCGDYRRQKGGKKLVLETVLPGLGNNSIVLQYCNNLRWQL